MRRFKQQRRASIEFDDALNTLLDLFDADDWYSLGEFITDVQDEAPTGALLQLANELEEAYDQDDRGHFADVLSLILDEREYG